MHAQRDGAFYARLAETLANSWRLKARPEQLPPAGGWLTWLILAGRGWGKTRTGAEWIQEQVLTGTASRIALVAATASDARDVIVEGESGLLAIAPRGMRPEYEPSKRRLTWPNGAMATTFSADEPDRLRGPQFDAAWCDEIAAWKYPESWSMLQFGLRLGKQPRVVVTTTPKPVQIIRDLQRRHMAGDKTIAITRGRTNDNRDNLAATFLAEIERRYGGTRLGRQELNGELLEDIPGALWTRTMIDAAQVDRLPEMARVVVAVDPSGTKGSGDDGDSIGIVVAGKGIDGLGYILADRTCKLSPDGWGRRAVEAYREFKADRIVAERNFGGAMVEHVLRTVDANIPYKEVTASRGKIARAEPVAALYEQCRVKHRIGLTELEDQLCAMTADGYVGDGSPDRADAAVWALSELVVTGSTFTLDNIW
ncbi:DNA-packaging protein [Kaistia terrae]|uniref:DNA-packaging protein n=1 Tax=Kaistia terrae TaxID=537017 RepID=A0ABW0PWK8_9HYPH|nr:terminase family protein [Kaistia terrae]MCX5579451.1 terminase family protein [Kaistia terrae]